MSDDYNPDNFDWGDGPGIELDSVGPDILEQLVLAALNVHEEKFGWRYLKRSELKESGGRLFKAKYFMPVEGRTWFEENFPGYTFVWDSAVEHHDHPVSRLCRELNEIAMAEEFVRSGEQYIDLFGNGGRNVKYKRNCINLYSMTTPKDYIRYQNVGPRDFLYDIDKLCDPSSVFGKINRITITDALYYLKMDDIGRIVNTSSKRMMSALIFRHKETYGTLNGGEQEYWVSEDGIVTQVNVATGEKYTHPSLEALFHQGSAKTLHGGVAWTIRAAGGDGFIVDFVGCPNEICESYVPLKFLKPESWQEYAFSNLKVRKFLHWTWMTASTQAGNVRIEDVDLFNKLRRYVAGKERTPRLKAETMNHARRLCNKADIISIHGGGASEIPVASMHDYVEVATYVDVRAEFDSAISFHKDNVVITQALNVYYSSGKLPKDFTALTGAAVKTGRMFSDAAVGVINCVREMDKFNRGLYEGKVSSHELDRLAIEYEPGGKIPGAW